MKHVRHRIDGKPYDGTGGRSGDLFDPTRGVVVGTVDHADAADVDTAVAAAQAAFTDWRAGSLSKRTQLLFAFRHIVASRVDQLAEAISAEHGKVVSDARGEVARGLEVLEFACGIGELLKGEHSENVSNRIDTWSARQPLGVVAGITPFNFPAMVPMWMFPLAIACGNTFVLKPSERDPSASTMLADWFTEAGLPGGVLNVVHGDAATVTALIEHPGVRAVSFVGSTPVARWVYETAVRHGKRVQALGGAKNHMVVLPDADLDAAADAAVNAGYGSSGERCMAISVVVAVGDIADDLVARVASRTEAIGVGPTSDMGPLITAQHRDRVARLVDEGAAEGATLVVDRRDAAPAGLEDGFWLGPCLLDHVRGDMSVYREEIFGPVLCVVRAAGYDEALDLVNANPYGNGAAIFTNDGRAARRFQHEVEAGMVGVNVSIPVPIAWFPFGGWKGSLFGDTHVYGPDGVRFYTRGKVVTSRWGPPEAGGPQLGFPTHG